MEDAAQVIDPFASIDWARLDQRIVGLGQRIDGLDQRIDGLDHRIDALDAKVDATRAELELRIEAATAQSTAVFRTEIQRAIVTQTRITVFSMVTAFAAVSALALGLG